MTTVVNNPQIVPRPPAAAPALRAADRGVADALESVLSDNTRRVYGAQWRLFNEWCDSVGLTPLPAEPLTVARYLAVRAGDGASIATLRLAASAKAHESPCRDQGVRASLKGRERRLAKPQRQAGALTADMLAVIRLTAVQPRLQGRGIETPAQAAERARFDVALVAALSDGGLRRSETDRRQLVLPVATTIFAGRDGVIIRYGGTVDYRPTNQAIEAETYGRQDTGNGSGQGWDERAFSAQVAEWAIAVAGETGASVAHPAGSLRRGVGG